MPYTQANAPPAVKKLPDKKRRQWIAIFNSASARGASEASAFRQAWGTVNKNIVVEGVPAICEHIGVEGHVCSEKCMPEMAYEAPLGGAINFSGAEDWLSASELANEAADLWSIFNGVLRNIRDDEDMALPAKAAAVEQAAKDYGDRLQGLERNKGLIGTVKQVFQNVFGGKPEPQTPSAFMVTKDLAGSYRWMAIVSNNFYDRDGEVFPEAAHREFVEYVDRQKDYPELWLWHTPGSRLGQSDLVEYVDGFLIASGTFDKGREAIAERLRTQRKKLGVSHGFGYLAQHLTKDGQYLKYRTFEISPLPAEKAANPWTAFNAEEVEFMGLSKDKRAFLVGVLGEEPVSRIETELPAFAKALRERGVSFKDVATDFLEDGEERPGGDAPPAGDDDSGGDGKPEGDTPPAGDEDAPKGDTPPAGDEENEEDKAVPVGTLAQIASALTSINTVLPSLQTSVAELTGRVKQLEKTDDEKLADKMSPRRPAPEDTNRATERDDNLIPTDLAQKILGEDKGEEAPNGSARKYAEDILNAAGRIAGNL